MVSRGGGVLPRWSPDGNTIYYWSGYGQSPSFLAARVERGPPFVVTATDTILRGGYSPFNWDLHPDGDRIVTTQNVASTESGADEGGERFIVVVNWFEELRERMGGS